MVSLVLCRDVLGIVTCDMYLEIVNLSVTDTGYDQ
jgi:hypothetical protein